MPVETNLPTSFTEILRTGRSEKARCDTAARQQMSWHEVLQKTKAEAEARSGDPWRLRLERVRGESGYDGVERISTQELFDLLEVPQRASSAGACRRLAMIMRELGWTPMKARGLGQSGFKDQVRGYARDSRINRMPGPRPA